MNTNFIVKYSKLSSLFGLLLILNACGAGSDGDNDSASVNSDQPNQHSQSQITRDIGLYFNEVMREVRLNDSANHKDEDNSRQPWLELYNSTNAPISLEGLHLVVEGAESKRWSFPVMTLEAGEFLRVWGSGKDRNLLSGQLHTSFSLIGADSIALHDSEGEILDLLSNVTIPADQSYGRFPDGGDWTWFYTNPTPEQANPRGDIALNANCHDLSLTAGKPFQARVTPDRDVIWSSNSSRVSVDNKGIMIADQDVYGENASATLSAIDNRGNTTDCKVTIVGWTANRSSLKIVGTPDADFLLDYLDDNIYFTTPGKIMTSTDGMLTNTQVGVFPPTPSPPILKKTPYGYYASSGNTLYSSADFNSWKTELQMRHKNLKHGLTHYFDKNNNISFIYAGEYSVGNSDVHSVYRGTSYGGEASWKEVLYWDSLQDFYNDNRNLNTIRHVHLVVTDPYTGHVWVGTGDADQHSRLYYSADNGDTFTLVGIGSQKFRSLSIWFTEQFVYWNMDSELAPQYVFRLPRSVHDKNGRWPSLTPELTSGSTKPGTKYLVTASKGKHFPVKTGGIYTENTSRTISSKHRVRPIEDPSYDYSEEVAKLTHASHWYHLWVKDQQGEDVLIMNTSAEGLDQFRRDLKSRTFGFKEKADGSVDVQELLSMPSDTPDRLNLYTQLTPYFQDKQGYIYFQGRNTAHRIYKMTLDWVD